MKKLSFVGVKDTTYTAESIDLQDFSVTFSECYNLSSARDSTTKQSILDDGSTVYKIEFENGFIDFATYQDLEDRNQTDLIHQIEGESDHIFLNRNVDVDGQKRGKFLEFVKRIFVGKLEDALTEAAAKALVKKLEKKFMPKEGIAKCLDPSHFDTKKLARKSDWDLTQPNLLLIHGTASDTQGSFASLATENNASRWQDIVDHYGQNIFATDHHTLVKSPIENALDIAKAVPKGTNLDLLTHSRGGLVAEVLTRATNEGRDEFFALFTSVMKKAGKRQNDILALKSLLQECKKKELTIRKVVRVACPAGGTILASKRLDFVFKILLNAVGAISMNPIVARIYGHVQNLLLGVLKSRLNPEIMPGIEAMNPDSPFIALLQSPVLKNKEEIAVATQLSVVAGDVTYDFSWKSLLTLVADGFFWEQNDYVVDTLSMFQGLPRRISDRETIKPGYFYAKFKDAWSNHLAYFTHPNSAQAITDALMDNEALSSFFLWHNPLEEQLEDVVRSDAFDPNKPTVILLPGIMGTKLKVDDKNIWVHIGRLMTGKMAQLHIDNPAVQTNGLIGSAYNDIVRYLSATHNVITFPYDWRKSLSAAADDLAEVVQSAMALNPNNPVHLLAHSMGGLVVHHLYNQKREVWKNLRQHNADNRVMFMGSPLRGSYVVVEVMLRLEKRFRQLHKMDFTHTSEELLSVIGDFPGLLQLLPFQERHDYMNADTWADFKKYDPKMYVPKDKNLNEARALANSMIESPIEGDNLVYVAGKDDATPYDLKIDESKTGEAAALKILYTPAGDGRVPWKTGIPREITNVWFMNASHGDLCNVEKTFDAIADLLASGTTNRNTIFRQSPLRSGPQEDVPVSYEPLIALNDSKYMEAALLGISPKETVAEPEILVEAWVSHGDLGFAKFPVAVGHHDDDSILFAESVVDRKLGGQLQKHYALGRYPGKPDTALVILQDSQFKGGIVVGLGNFGELTDGLLELYFATAIKEYVLTAADRKQVRGASQVFGVSTLLIGTSYSGLSTRAAIRSMLRGLARANSDIAKLKNADFAPVRAIEFIELYEDRAIQAANELRDLSREHDLGWVQLSKNIIKSVDGGRDRLANDEARDWWLRMSVNFEDRGANSFFKWVSNSSKARAEEVIETNMEAAIEPLVRSTIQSSRFNSDLSNALYNLLLPNEFKSYLIDGRNIVLTMDEKAAQIPWELVHDNRGKGNKPMLASFGFVRQLKLDRFLQNPKYATSDTALVVANPTTSHHPNLPSAAREGKIVSELLRSAGTDVHATPEQASGSTVITQIFKHDYKILHLAGHGEVDANPMQSGMILSNGQRITPALIKKLSVVPDFVFINCCHLGATGGKMGDPLAQEHLEIKERHRLAANLGTQLIAMGAKAVVAAGWAIDDKAAETFAHELYEKMLLGTPFGEAVMSARAAIFKFYPHTNTWGAYQCYGDPFYQLRQGKVWSETEREPYVHIKEGVVELCNLLKKSEASTSRNKASVLKQLGGISRRMKKEWLENPQVISLMAEVYFEMTAYDEAILKYAVLFENHQLEASLRDLNLYITALTKYAFQRQKSVHKSVPTFAQAFKEAKKYLAVVQQIGEGENYWAMRAGQEKRHSVFAKTKKERLKLIKMSAISYATAYEKSPRSLNERTHLWKYELVLDTLAGWYGTRSAKEKEVLKELNALMAEVQKTEAKDFWMNVALANLYAVKALLSEKTTKIDPKILIENSAQRFKTAWEYGGTIRKGETVMDQIALIEEHLVWLVKDAANKKNHSEKSNEIENLAGHFTQLKNNLRDLIEE